MKAHTGSLDESLRTIPYCALRYYEALLELVYLVLCTGLLVLRGTDWQLLWSMQPFDTQIVKYSLVFLCVESALWGLGWFCLCCSCTARDRLARNQYLEVLDVCLLCVLIGCAVWGLVLLTLSETGLHVNWALSCLIDYARGGALGLGLLLRFLHLALHNLGLLSSFTLEETGKTSLAHSYHVAESIGAIGSRPGMRHQIPYWPFICVKVKQHSGVIYCCFDRGTNGQRAASSASSQPYLSQPPCFQGRFLKAEPFWWKVSAACGILWNKRRD
uniref:Uncharacterized protein n=1 Tax=Tetraselmis sp. GSL018 TaxID=582737 RepID=A0A061RXD7_9CHLO